MAWITLGLFLVIYLTGVAVGIWARGLADAAKENTEEEGPGEPIPLTAFYARIAQTADTDGTKINAAIVSRVMRVAFDVLAAMPPANRRRLLASGLARAARRTTEGQP